MKRTRIILVVSFVLGFSYIGIFGYWWHISPTKVRVVSGKQVHYVSFHMTRFRWNTRLLWLPAFVFMEKIVGYEQVSVIAASHESIYTYAK
jgi:hypothetical protein